MVNLVKKNPIIRKEDYVGIANEISNRFSQLNKKMATRALKPNEKDLVDIPEDWYATKGSSTDIRIAISDMRSILNEIEFYI